jgi:hypothetical protein
MPGQLRALGLRRAGGNAIDMDQHPLMLLDKIACLVGRID